MAVGSRLTTKNLIIAASIGATLAAIVPAASDAADLERFSGGKYAGTSRGYSNWRERCAYAGYYCLYAWRYHYRWDDYPYPYAFYPRRQWTRY